MYAYSTTRKLRKPDNKQTGKAILSVGQAGVFAKSSALSFSVPVLRLLLALVTALASVAASALTFALAPAAASAVTFALALAFALAPAFACGSFSFWRIGP